MGPYRIWQLVDSAFPSGGFAHSAGLEAALRLGQVRDEGAFERHAKLQVDQAGCFLLPFTLAAFDRPSEVAAIDVAIDRATINHVANRASRAQGQAFVAAAAAAFDVPAVADLRARCRDGALLGHLAPMFGAALAHLDVGREDAGRLLLHQHLRNLLASAVRLNVVGPMEAQAVLASLAPFVEATWERHRARRLGDAAQSAPLLDVWQGHHDRLYSRLFSS